MLSCPSIFNLFIWERQWCLATDITLTLKIIWFFSVYNGHLLIKVHLATGKCCSNILYIFICLYVWVYWCCKLYRETYYRGMTLLPRLIEKAVEEIMMKFLPLSLPKQVIGIPVTKLCPFASEWLIFSQFLQETGCYNVLQIWQDIFGIRLVIQFCQCYAGFERNEQVNM